MGSPEGENGRSSDESQVEVRLSEPFWLAKTEVTQAQWEAVMDSNPSSFKSPKLPVENVSWEDAQAYLTKLNEKGILPEGWKFALPTEAQWEYACRAGEKGPYSGGSLEEVGWYDGNSGSNTHEVGQKKPNAWGLHDMHGNVWEWCSDLYDGTLKGGVDPTGPSSGVHRVSRGGSWYYVASCCRAAFRSGYFPGDRFDRLGFRPALVPSR
jgi:formylglycine-generating enzyme required for sulfatase activity